MSRAKPPRLYLKEQKRPRANAWYIRDGAKRVGTGCREQDLEGAERILRNYLNEKYEPPQGLGSDLLVVEAVAAYLKDYASHSRSKEFLLATAEPLLAWWSGKKVRATGTVSEFSGNLQMTIEKWDQLKKIEQPNPEAEK